MKLSYRDKVIFLVTIILTLLLCGYFLLISPKMEEYDSAKLSLESKRTEKIELEDKLEMLPLLADNLKKTVEEIETTQNRFLKASAPYEFEMLLRETLDENNVTLMSMNTSYTVAESITEYMYIDPTLYSYDMQIDADIYNELPQEIYDLYNNTAPELARNMMLGVTEVEIGYGIDPTSFDISSVLNFIDAVAEEEKTMTVLNLSTPSTADIEAAANPANGAETGTKPQLQTGTLSMRLYSIHPLNTEKVINGDSEADANPEEAEEPTEE